MTFLTVVVGLAGFVGGFAGVLLVGLLFDRRTARRSQTPAGAVEATPEASGPSGSNNGEETT